MSQSMTTLATLKLALKLPTFPWVLGFMVQVAQIALLTPSLKMHISV